MAIVTDRENLSLKEILPEFEIDYFVLGPAIEKAF